MFEELPTVMTGYRGPPNAAAATGTQPTAVKVATKDGDVKLKKKGGKVKAKVTARTARNVAAKAQGKAAPVPKPSDKPKEKPKVLDTRMDGKDMREASNKAKYACAPWKGGSEESTANRSFLCGVRFAMLAASGVPLTENDATMGGAQPAWFTSFQQMFLPTVTAPASKK